LKGIFIRQSNEVIEKVAKQGEILSLLAKGDGVEIMHQTIRAGETFAISPGESPELMEFYYILEGSITVLSDDRRLDKGCYFYVHYLEDTVYFKANKETMMLYVSSQPVFHLLSEEINELTNICKLVEEKDKYTLEHNKRLVDYSIKVGRRMNLSEERLDTLYYAALFHDLGKINIPDEILSKPGKLTPEEFEIIKKHPSDGKNLVVKTYLKETAEIIEQHHERLNGTGYPNGLKEEQILTEAKIIAVVDSFDAMISERPYKKAMPVKDVIDELKSLCNILYDKSIVDIFEQILIEENKL
jgi:HD-GYP domain-containing protein (c-di-GMP phosphodiesterase class II)